MRTFILVKNKVKTYFESKNIFYFVWIVIVLSISMFIPAYSMDPPPSILFSEENNYDPLPIGYTRNGHNIRNQCEKYREVLDPIFDDLERKNPNFSKPELLESMANIHIPKLLEIFKEGIKITHDFIASRPASSYPLYFYTKNNESVKMKPEEHQNTFISYVHGLWNLAQILNREERFSPKNFSLCNQILAYFVTDYKLESASNRPFYSSDALKSLCNVFSVTQDNLDVDIFNEDPIRFAFTSSQSLFILYANPDANVKKRGISVETLVNQYINYKYPGNLVLFDIHSTPLPPEKSTKKDPHYSSVNGTHRLFKHDDIHYKEIIKSSKKDPKFFYEIIPYWGSIATKLENMGRQNDASIVKYGIFYLFHEYTISEFLETAYNAKTYLDEIMEKIHDKNYGINKSLSVSRQAYKKDGRDWEEALKLKDENGETFLSTIKTNGHKYRAFPIAKDSQDTFHIIENESFFRDNMQYVNNHKAPQNIRNNRLVMLTAGLKNGYKRFWVRFQLLIEEGMQ